MHSGLVGHKESRGEAGISARPWPGLTLGQHRKPFIAPAQLSNHKSIFCVPSILSHFPNLCMLQNTWRLQQFCLNFGKAFELPEIVHTIKSGT